MELNQVSTLSSVLFFKYLSKFIYTFSDFKLYLNVLIGYLERQQFTLTTTNFSIYATSDQYFQFWINVIGQLESINWMT